MAGLFAQPCSRKSDVIDGDGAGDGDIELPVYPADMLNIEGVLHVGEQAQREAVGLVDGLLSCSSPHGWVGPECTLLRAGEGNG